MGIEQSLQNLKKIKNEQIIKQVNYIQEELNKNSSSILKCFSI